MLSRNAGAADNTRSIRKYPPGKRLYATANVNAGNSRRSSPPILSGLRPYLADRKRFSTSILLITTMVRRPWRVQDLTGFGQMANIEGPIQQATRK
jgi:hypothetical protein